MLFQKKKNRGIPEKSSTTEVFLEMEGLSSTNVHQKELDQVAYISLWRLQFANWYENQLKINTFLLNQVKKISIEMEVTWTES